MKIREFVENYKAKTFINTRQGVDEKSEWIRTQLDIKSYIPFMKKREIAEMIVSQNIEVVDGIKKYRSIDAYIGFVMASIIAHTNLKCSDNPIADYDLLAESGLLPKIVTEFQESYNEIDTLLKMVVASELEDNNISVLIGHFLDGVLKKLDGLSGILSEIDIDELFNNENVANIIGILDKLK